MSFFANLLILVAILVVVLVLWQVLVNKDQRKSTLKISMIWIVFGAVCYTALYLLGWPSWL